MFSPDAFNDLVTSGVHSSRTNIPLPEALPRLPVPTLPFGGLLNLSTTLKSDSQPINHSLREIMSNIFGARDRLGLDFVDSAAPTPLQLPSSQLPMTSKTPSEGRASLELSADSQNVLESSSGTLSFGNDTKKTGDTSPHSSLSWPFEANGLCPSTSVAGVADHAVNTPMSALASSCQASGDCRQTGQTLDTIATTLDAPRNCHLCGYTAVVHSEFLTHLRNHYGYQCPKCDYSSRTEGRLRRHMESFHSAVPPENFSGKSSKSSDKPKNRNCKQCSYVAATKVSSPIVQREIRNKLTGVNSCRVCGDALRKTDYWNHQRTHIKVERLLQCPQCPFVTEYRHHLDYHVRNHMGSKPYKCTKCNYECVNKSMLNSHMKSHTNVHQYRCANCTYATKYCHSLKMHLTKLGHTQTVVLNSDGSLPERNGSLAIKGEAQLPPLPPVPPSPPPPPPTIPPLFSGFPSIPPAGMQSDPMLNLAALMLSFRPNQDPVFKCREDPPSDEALDLSAPRKPVRGRGLVESASGCSGQLLECPYCEIIFKNEELYRVHIQFHNPLEPFRCSRCGINSHNPVDFFNHLSEKAHRIN